MLRRKKQLIRALVLPVGLAVAFAAYLASEILLRGRWISHVIYEGDWTEGARVASFAIAAVLIWLVSRLRYSEYLRAVESEEGYEAMLEKSLSGIVIYRDDRALFANSRLRRMLGYEDMDVEQSDLVIWDFVHEDDRERVRRLSAERTPDRPIDLSYECRFVTRSGETVWAEVVSFVIQYGGRPAVLVKVYDVTERKRAEEQLMHSSRLAELGEMAASVAHELNQPLTGIRNWAKNAAYMIENAVGDSSEVAENLALISEQVDRASKIINQMRDLTRRADQDLQLLDIDSVVRQAVDFLDHQFKLSGIEVALDLAEDLPDVIGVRVRLEQVFLNIMTNARQSMEEVEDRRLTVRTGAEGQEVIVEIADTGKGFSPADRDRIFAPFYSTKKPGHGTGLGLSISESIVEQHGGRIEASSEEGAGARFIVRLPAAREGQRPEED